MVGSDQRLVDKHRLLNVGHDLALLAFDMFIEEFKQIVLPLRDRKIKQVVSVF